MDAYPPVAGSTSNVRRDNAWPVIGRDSFKTINTAFHLRANAVITDLDNYRRQREQQSRAIPVKVLRETDPENANRNYYFILGEHLGAVQSAIDSLLAEAESFGNGYGEFTGPRLHDGLYFAFGEVVVRPDILMEYCE